jgi:photosystem II stability/assembly factor-like uncharacterized protein
MHTLIGTTEGLHELGEREATQFAGREVTALASEDGGDRWALLQGRALARRETDSGWREVGTLPDGVEGTCLAATRGGLLVGTVRAGLWRWTDGGPVRVESFERMPGRDGWYTPWGDPPDTRSIAEDAGGPLYVNVHVGGVARSTDGGASWSPTIDVDADVHQVAAHPTCPGYVFAAAAEGLWVSADGGDSWTTDTGGLHARYCRAVAVTEDTVLVSASTGPGGRRAALYRRDLVDDRFERCRDGLPEWFTDNLDTHCLAASGRVVVLGTEDGVVHASTDGGRTFSVLAKGLPPVRAVVLL